MNVLLKFLSILFLLIACNSNEVPDANKDDQPKVDCEGVYYIPSPTGPGTGVCEVKLIVINDNLIAEETCGGHDDYGRTETTEILFETDFKSNYKYKVSDLINTSLGSSFGCDYFEIKDQKLILYDSDLNIVKDWFCVYGRAEALIDLSYEEREEQSECDCIFLRASEEVSEKYLKSDEGQSEVPQSKEDRINEIKEWYGEVQRLGLINCDVKNKSKYESANSMDMEVSFDQVVKNCNLNKDFNLIRGEFSGYEWNDNVVIYKRKDRIFFVYIEGAAESSYWEYRYYCDKDENVIKILKKEGDMMSESSEENREISLDPSKQSIQDYIKDYLKDIEFVTSSK